ncbi:MAG: hypothetical protein LUQ11_15140 [Methylococcaceae bacterium]|nr:hypothetical protein [Methylococcaceae bacterium]
MIIDNAAIKLLGQHQQHQQTKRSESLQLWVNQPAPPPVKTTTDKLDLSAAAAKAPATQSREMDLEKRLDSFQSLALQIIKRMVKEVTGRDFKLFSPEELQAQADQVSYQEPLQAPTQAAETQGSTGTGLIYQRSMSYAESETTTFNAEGSVTTKDGKSIAFSVSLSMSRSFYTESNLTIRAGDAAKTDPLVINFDGIAAELSSTKFQFDIDANGSPDQIALLKSGSGMLALDKNRDGLINDGSELFGPKSGDGFAELAAYDVDQNQFIDEADPIYQQLRIWQRFEDGSQKLMALGDKNIGAIFLGHVSTPFQLKTAENASLGEVASSGVYLKEDGSAGSVQQINFTA